MFHQQEEWLNRESHTMTNRISAKRNLDKTALGGTYYLALLLVWVCLRASGGLWIRDTIIVKYQITQLRVCTSNKDLEDDRAQPIKDNDQ